MDKKWVFAPVCCQICVSQKLFSTPIPKPGLTIDCCCWFWFWSRLSADDLKIGLDKVEALKVKTSEFVGGPPTKVEQWGLSVP